jgi:hypothetical protein
MNSRVIKPQKELDKAIRNEAEQKTANLLSQIKQFTDGAGDEKALVQEIIQELDVVMRLTALEDLFLKKAGKKYTKILDYIKTQLSDDSYVWGSLFSWLFVHSLGKIVTSAGNEQQSRTWIDEWLLGRIIAGSLRDFGLDEPLISKAVTTIKLLTSQQHWFKVDKPSNKWAHKILNSLLKDSEARQFLHINRHQDILWFNKEDFEQLLWWMLMLAVIGTFSNPQMEKPEAAKKIATYYDVVMKLHQAGEDSGYQVEKLTELLKD